MLHYCPQCGTPSDPVTGVCPQCSPAAAQQPSYQQSSYQQPYGQIATAQPLKFYEAPPASRFSGQWNWGAFLLNPFWLMNHGNVGLGIGVLVCQFIPLLNMLTLVSAIYYGIKGNDIAMRYRNFADEAQFVAVQNAWRNWGFGLLIVGLVFGFLAVVLSVIGAAMMGAHSHY